ncbi:MAG: hypothetical protein WCI94_15045 [Rhodospirillales bacterium]
MPPRLIVADPGLRGLLGHHFAYSLAVAEAAQLTGIAPVVLASAAFRETLPGGIACRPCFAAGYQSAGQGGSLRRAVFGLGSRLPAPLAQFVAPPFRAMRRAMRRSNPDGFAAELALALVGLGDTSADLVLLHSVSANNLAGLASALRPDSLGVLAVVLRRTPDDMDRDDAGPQPTAAILSELRAVLGVKLRLYADSGALARMWSRATAQAVREAPLPIVAPPVRDDTPSAPPHLVFAGGARAEKGYGLLPDLVRSMGSTARFTIQSGPVGAGDDPIVQQAHRQLRAAAGSDLALVERSLSPDEYMALIQSADLLLLPYRAHTYGPRSSGILAEARAMGVPAVVPAGCWMEDEVGPEPRLAFASDGAFAERVRWAVAHLSDLLPAYAASAPQWRQAHSPAALLARLLSPTS